MTLVSVLTKDRPEEARRRVECLLGEEVDVLVVGSPLPDLEQYKRAYSLLGHELLLMNGEYKLCDRNLAFDVAKDLGHEEILFLDDDNALTPGYIELLKDGMTPGVVGISGFIQTYGQRQYKQWRDGYGPPHDYSQTLSVDGGVLYLGNKVQVLPSRSGKEYHAANYLMNSYMVKTSCRARFPDARWGEDVAFTHALSREGELRILSNALMFHFPSVVGGATTTTEKDEEWALAFRQIGIEIHKVVDGVA